MKGIAPFLLIIGILAVVIFYGFMHTASLLDITSGQWNYVHGVDGSLLVEGIVSYLPLSPQQNNCISWDGPPIVSRCLQYENGAQYSYVSTLDGVNKPADFNIHWAMVSSLHPTDCRITGKIGETNVNSAGKIDSFGNCNLDSLVRIVSAGNSQLQFKGSTQYWSAETSQPVAEQPVYVPPQQTESVPVQVQQPTFIDSVKGFFSGLFRFLGIVG